MYFAPSLRLLRSTLSLIYLDKRIFAMSCGLAFLGWGIPIGEFVRLRLLSSMVTLSPEGQGSMLALEVLCWVGMLGLGSILLCCMTSIVVEHTLHARFLSFHELWHVLKRHIFVCVLLVFSYLVGESILAGGGFFLVVVILVRHIFLLQPYVPIYGDSSAILLAGPISLAICLSFILSTLLSFALSSRIVHVSSFSSSIHWALRVLHADPLVFLCSWVLITLIQSCIFCVLWILTERLYALIGFSEIRTVAIILAGGIYVIVMGYIISLCSVFWTKYYCVEGGGVFGERRDNGR